MLKRIALRITCVTWTGGALFLAAACGQPGTLRQNDIAQDNASIQAKYQELAPAEGTYQGTVTLKKSQQTFDATIRLKRTMETRRNPQSDDPSNTVSVPTLTGSLRFLAIDNLQPEDYHGFRELLDPLGGFAAVLFDFGDYNPSTQQLVLPYNVPGNSGSTFGNLTGTLKNGIFTGDWSSEPFDAGTFTLTIEGSHP